MLIDFLKNNLFVQNMVGALVSFVPSVAEHNVSKYRAIKHAMYQTGLEHTHGAYLEFGVFTGSSFTYAMRIHRALRYLGDIETEFVGFDSFKGFGDVSEEDEHPFFIDEIFSVNAERVKRNIHKVAKGLPYRLVEGFFEDTISDCTAADMGIEKARVVMIDCDLKGPTELALNFVRPALQEGTIIMFDEYNNYRGNPSKGEYGAFENFRAATPEFGFRRMFEYGFGGRVFITYARDGSGQGESEAALEND